MTSAQSSKTLRRLAVPLLGVFAGAALAASMAAQTAGPRTFKTPEEAVQTLISIVKTGKLDDLLALFGTDGRDLVAGSDPATARKNRDVFTIAAAEGWHLVDDGQNRKTLVIGNENWPFPVPVIKDGSTWRFDSVAGKEEVIARRIGRNELAVIEICQTYVVAQQRYAEQGHDGKPAGLYAKTFRSDAGKQNGLYWAAARGQKKSPLGDLLAEAAEDQRPQVDAAPQSTFHGYYFKILTAQGAAAAGGAKSYLVNGELSGGFALVAWPAQHDVSGIMTFIVGRDGVVYEKDLGAQTDSVAKAMTSYNPDQSWRKVVP